MAIYRNVNLSFWTDNKVEDEFTPEDKYFYLYLLTNPQTNICGCYEVSFKQICMQTGYNKDTINRLIKRFDATYNLIRYNESTKEILVLNWHKYNWSRSPKAIAGINSVAAHIKHEPFRDYILSLLEGTVVYPETTVDDCPKAKAKRAKSEPKTYFDNPQLNDAFADFVKARKEARAPMTERAITLAINELTKLATLPFAEGINTELALDIINQSILRGWKSFYPLKNDVKSGKGEKNIAEEWGNS